MPTNAIHHICIYDLYVHIVDDGNFSQRLEWPCNAFLVSLKFHLWRLPIKVHIK